MGIASFSIKNSVLILFLTIGAICVGLFSALSLKIEAYPDVSDPEVTIISEFTGRAAEEVEKQITIPLERVLNGLPGVISRRSQSIMGLSVIRLTFEEGTNSYFARTLVNEKLGDVNLPEGVKPVLGPLSSPVGEIYRYVLESDQGVSVMDMRSFQDWEMVPRILQVPGIADVTTFGGEVKTFQIVLNPINLGKYDIDLEDISKAVEANNANTGGNAIQKGAMSVPVRSLGAVTNESDISNIVLTSLREIPIFIRDVGKVVIVPAIPKGVLGYFAKEDDNVKIESVSSVEGIILMRKGENPSEVLHRLKERLKDIDILAKEKKIQIRTIYDREVLVNNTLKTVARTMLEGITIVVFILIFLLGNWKAAFLTALAIPFSLLFAFILMDITSIPANLFSLGAIDFGIIADSSVVMTEMIFATYLMDQAKKNPWEVTLEKAGFHVEKEIFFSVLIIIFAYLPIFLFQRVEGRLFKPMAYTLSFTLLGSLIFSLTALPVLTKYVLKDGPTLKVYSFSEKLHSFYLRTLNVVLQNPQKFLKSVSLGVVISVLFGSFWIGTEFIPEMDEGSINLRCILPAGVSLKKSTEIAGIIRSIANKYPEIVSVVTQAGRNDDGTDPFGSNRIESLMTLKPYDEWQTFDSKKELVDELFEKMSREVPGAHFSFSQPILDNVSEAVTGSAADLSIQVIGDDLVQLRETANQIISLISSVRGTGAIGIEQEGSQTELVIRMDREQSARYGINFAEILDITEMAIGGKTIGRLYSNNQFIDISVRYPEESRRQMTSIENLLIESNTRKKYPLQSLTSIKLEENPSKIARVDGKRFVSVWVNIEGRDQGSYVTEARKILDSKFKIPKSQKLKWGGQYENLTRAGKRLLLAVPLALFIIFGILYSLYKNAKDSFFVFSNIPISLSGGLLFLILRGMNMNISAGVGFISLFGDAIMSGVLYTSELKRRAKEDIPWNEAVKLAAEHQFRPRLLMMSVAILGLIPAAFKMEIGSDIQRPLATVILGGLLSTFFLGLYVLPCLYLVFPDQKKEK
jgi:cobalt-zinc-cadmium resistance protein CzcA